MIEASSQTLKAPLTMPQTIRAGSFCPDTKIHRAAMPTPITGSAAQSVRGTYGSLLPL